MVCPTKVPLLSFERERFCSLSFLISWLKVLTHDHRLSAGAGVRLFFISCATRSYTTLGLVLLEVSELFASEVSRLSASASATFASATFASATSGRFELGWLGVSLLLLRTDS